MAITSHAISVTLDGLGSPALPPITGAVGVPPGGFGVTPSIPDDGTAAGVQTEVGAAYIPPPGAGLDPEVGWHADWTIVDAIGSFNSARTFFATSVDISQVPPSGSFFQPFHYLTVEAGDRPFALIDALDNFRGLVNSVGARMVGNDGDNFLEGGAKGDDLYGNGGSDTITGLNGADDMWGGGDCDTFVFKHIGDSDFGIAGRDKIHDFQGHDHTVRSLVQNINDLIDLSAIDADKTQAGNQDFHFVAGGHYAGSAGELIEQRGVVKGDTDGDGHSNFAINVHGLGGTADDFVL
jgi:Ca2+-binding RTX toxin-like protein